MGVIRELDEILIAEWTTLVNQANIEPTDVGTSDSALITRKDLYSLLLHIDQFGRRPHNAVKHLCMYVEQYDSDDDVRLPRIVAAGLIYLSWAMNASAQHREWSSYANVPQVMRWLPTVPRAVAQTDDGEKEAIAELQKQADELTALEITTMHQQAITNLTDQQDFHTQQLASMFAGITTVIDAEAALDVKITKLEKQLRYTAYKASAQTLLLMLAAFVIFYKYFA